MELSDINNSDTMELKLLEKLNYYNPWWQNMPQDFGILRKSYLTKILPFLKTEEIIAVSGIRRCGKTFFLWQIINHLLSPKAKTDFKNILFIQGDDEYLNQIIKEQSFIHIIQEYLNWRKLDLENLSKTLYVFIDEIQNIDNWEIQLKNIFDLKRNIKFIVSGSSTAKLKSNALKKLVGRIIFFQIYPLSFSEFIFFKENKEMPEWQLNKGFKELKNTISQKIPYKNILRRNFLEYLDSGGYPRVVLEKEQSVKEKLLRDYLDLIIKRDISSVFSIEHLSELENILSFLGKNTANKISFFRISKETGMKIETVKKYYYYLEQAYLIFNINFFKASLKKTRRPYKFYLTDLGLRNLLSGDFGIKPSETLLGNLVESAIANFLSRQELSVGYWEDKQGDQVDFIVKSSKNLLPIEVKYQSKIDFTSLKGLIKFVEEYKPLEALVITKNLYQEKKIGKTRLLAVPAYYL